MPRKSNERDRYLTLDDCLRVVRIPGQTPKRKKSRRMPALPAAEAFSPVDSLLRHRSLLMAALRVWELRNGIHEGW